MSAQNLIYDDTKYVKRNTIASGILWVKLISTLPFNLVGLYRPELLWGVPWILYIEAFHHYHARIFYLLALHRNLTQVYGCVFSNGWVQRRLICLECIFDMSLIGLYLHEYFLLHNVRSLFTLHTSIHLLICLLSLYSLKITSRIKVEAIA